MNFTKMNIVHCFGILCFSVYFHVKKASSAVTDNFIGNGESHETKMSVIFYGLWFQWHITVDKKIQNTFSKMYFRLKHLHLPLTNVVRVSIGFQLIQNLLSTQRDKYLFFTECNRRVTSTDPVPHIHLYC